MFFSIKFFEECPWRKRHAFEKVIDFCLYTDVIPGIYQRVADGSADNSAVDEGKVALDFHKVGRVFLYALDLLFFVPRDPARLPAIDGHFFVEAADFAQVGAFFDKENVSVHDVERIFDGIISYFAQIDHGRGRNRPFFEEFRGGVVAVFHGGVNGIDRHHAGLVLDFGIVERHGVIGMAFEKINLRLQLVRICPVVVPFAHAYIFSRSKRVHYSGKRAVVFGPLIFGFNVGLDDFWIFGGVFANDFASPVAGGIVMGDDFKGKVGFLNQESFEALGDELFLIERRATDADERFGIFRPFGRDFILSS